MSKSRSLIIKRNLIVMFIGFTLFSGCGGDEPLTINEEAFLLLEGNWGLGTIVLDGVDITPNYPGFSLSFTANGYTSTAGGDLIGSGTWSWANDLGTDIALVEGKEIRLVTLNATSLVFTFTLNQDGGKAYGINGEYRVSLVK